VRAKKEDAVIQVFHEDLPESDWRNVLMKCSREYADERVFPCFLGVSFYKQVRVMLFSLSWSFLVQFAIR